ncbi:hypothetical protein [Phenylobacterium sp.]|uniref:hypothetical protein n=1 Tax=Phenylobacterium sp. TaxID=1871053 RepID=UPI0027293059|nr:hypothetical protein [Phenylobacterium sp.]MDO8801713.1 hypothetical protein [Phenylobacterium sp.]
MARIVGDEVQRLFEKCEFRPDHFVAQQEVHLVGGEIVNPHQELVGEEIDLSPYRRDPAERNQLLLG